VTVSLDTRIDAALRREGSAREFVSVLQNARKEAGLEVTDRIAVRWSCDDPDVSAALREHAEAISSEVLATEFVEGSGATRVDLNSVPVRFDLTRVEGS
jgi:isoleucyl-tRNA synthetase